MQERFIKELGILFLLVFVLFVSDSFSQSDVIVSNSFEKGTEKWEARGDRVSISSSKDQAADGEKSLRVSGRSAFWQGAQLNIIKLIPAGKIYRFSASVKLGKNEKPDNLKMTIQRGSGSGESTYDNLAAVNANSDDWQTLSGTFKPNGSDGYVLVYFEADRANTSFFIDNFKIELAGDGIPKQTGVLLQNDFEDLTAQNWTVRGDDVKMFSSNAFGTNSLKVSGRTATWHGLALDVSPMMFKGRTYKISLSVRLVRGQSADSLKITMMQTPPKGEVAYVPVSASTTATDAEWVKLSGEYTATTSNNNLLLYVEAAGASTAFHIDNFVIEIPETLTK